MIWTEAKQLPCIFGVTDQFIDCMWALNATAHLLYYTNKYGKNICQRKSKYQHAECNIVRELFVCQLHLYIVALIFGVTDQFIDCMWALNATAHLLYYTQQTNIQWEI
jgi:hypothetical protein